MTGVTLAVGDRFDTEYETGCVVTAAPGYDPVIPTNFLALDSEGVECLYNTVMLVPCPSVYQVAGGVSWNCQRVQGHQGEHVLDLLQWYDTPRRAVRS